MSLSQELLPGNLHSFAINVAFLRNHADEIAQFIRSSEIFDGFFLDAPPNNAELAHLISDAIVQNSHIRELRFRNRWSVIRDLVAWIGSCNTLVNMTSLEYVVVDAEHDMSVLDCSALFPLLLTSTSLRKFDISFGDDGCSDDVMSALLSYIGTASLRAFRFHTCHRRFSEAAFTALCDVVALSTVQQLTLCPDLFQNFNLEIGAESLARMIVESSLEEVWIKEWDQFEGLHKWNEGFIPALKLTAPVRNMDFAFTKIGDDVTQIGRGHTTHLRINRNWKPLIFSANTPLALWPHILEKSHASPETSHGSADIIFYVLRQKPDLVPAPYECSLRQKPD